MCVWPHSVGDGAYFPWCQLSCPSHPPDPHTQLDHQGYVASLQMGTCMLWVVTTAHHTWPPWRSTSPRCKMHPHHYYPLPSALDSTFWSPVPLKGSACTFHPISQSPTLEQGLCCGRGGIPLLALPSACPFITTGELMDTCGLHAEPAQLSGCGSTGGRPLCGWGQRWHKLPQLSGEIQPQGWRLGERGTHEHPQVCKPGVGGGRWAVVPP
jgi:hypothetical protein